MSKKDDEIIEMYRFCACGQDCVSDCPYHYMRDVDEYGPYWSGSCEACTSALESDYDEVNRKRTNHGKCKTCHFFVTNFIRANSGKCIYGCIENNKINLGKNRINVEGTHSCKNYLPYRWNRWDDSI